MTVAGLCVIATMTTMVAAAYAWRFRRQKASARAIALYCASLAAWNALHFIEIRTGGLAGKVVADSLQYLAIGVAGAAIYRVAWHELAWARLGQKLFGFLGGSAFVTSVVAAFAGLAGRPEARLSVSSPAILEYPFTAMDTIASLVFYTEVFVVVVLLLRKLAGEPAVWARRTLALLGALALPSVVAFFSLAVGLTIQGDRDTSPASSIIVSVCVFWLMRRSVAANITPLGRQAVFEAIQDAVFVIDASANVIDINHAACALVGVRPQDVVGKPVHDIKTRLPALGTCFAVQPQLHSRLEIDLTLAGEIRHFEVSQHAVKAEGEIVLGTAILLRDATIAVQSRRALSASHAQAQSALLQSEERFRTLLDQTYQVILMLDGDGNVKFANRAALGFFHTKLDDVIGKPWSALLQAGVPHDHQENMGAALTHAKDGAFERIVVPFEPNAGAKRVLDVSLTPVRSATGPVHEIILEGRDITAMLESQAKGESLQRQLFQSQRLEAVGRMAGGVAHDFNNLLMVILGNVSVLTEDHSVKPEQRVCLEDIERAAVTASEVVKQLLTFSRPRSVGHDVVELTDVLARTQSLAVHTAGDGVRFAWRVQEGLWPIVGDATQVQQILLNLVANARDATPEGGSVEVDIRNVSIAPEQKSHGTNSRPGNFVLFQVTDAGTGMSTAVIERAFDPFFTTKPEGRGTGLGLSVVYGAVQGMEGFLELRSEVGKGTTFEIYLPAADPSTRRASQDAVLVKQAPLKSTVWVVDDQSAVLLTMKRILEHHGCTVHVFDDPEGALAAAQTESTAPEILITDLSMPRMSGTGLARALVQRWPQLRVLFVSGYPDIDSKELDVGAACVELMVKPFSAEDFLQKLNDLRMTSVDRAVGIGAVHQSSRG
ncbi:MAG: PAS domain-containing protein [Deltaproteobacteria bacterium]|nr:PAS domain-containing protein [Deltaproteobacteria bacterium]